MIVEHLLKYLEIYDKYPQLCILNLNKLKHGGGDTDWSVLRYPSDDEEIERRQKLINWSRQAEKVTLQKGTKLYGTYPTACEELEARYCEDTGKTGKYFSTGIYIPLGMILEYKKVANLCTFELLEDVECYVGKYTFRQLEALRFYKSYEDIPNHVLDINPKKSSNHIDGSMFPIHELFDGDFVDIWEGEEEEVFLTAESLKKVRSVNNGEKISVSEAKEMVVNKLEEMIDNILKEMVENLTKLKKKLKYFD